MTKTRLDLSTLARRPLATSDVEHAVFKAQPAKSIRSPASSRMEVLMTQASACSLQSLRATLQSKGVHTADAWLQVTSAVGVSAGATIITVFGIGPRTKAFPFGVWTPFRVVLPVR